MALIGSIAISMTVQTAKLTKGLSDTISLVDRFSDHVQKRFGGTFDPLGNAIRATGSSLAYAMSPLKGLVDYTVNWGKALNSVFVGPALAGIKGFGTYLGNWGRALKEMYGDKLSSVAKGAGHLAESFGKVGKVSFYATKGLAKVGWWMGSKAFSGVSSIAGAFQRAGEAIDSSGKKLLVFGGIAKVVALAALFKVSRGAGALAEQTDRARIEFGGFSDEVIRQSNLMAVAYGISRKEFIASASAFAPVFEGAGYAEKDIASLSLAMAKLAGDISSKVDVPVEEAMVKLQSGLAGEVEPLRRLGISMTVANVNAYAYAKGIAKLGAELTEGQKIQARVGYIYEHSQKTLGNLAATSEGYGNITRSLSGRIENFSDTLGTALNTVIGPAVGELTVGIQAVQMAWEASSFSALSATSGVLSGTQQQAVGIGFVQSAIGKIADAWQYVSMGFSAFQSVALFGLSKVLSGLQALNDGLGAVLDKLGVGHGKVNTFFGDMAKDLEQSSFKAMDDFNAKAMAPALSDTINAAFDASRKKIAEARTELLKPGVDVTKLVPTAQATTTAMADKFASVEAVGSKEAANTLLRSQYGAGAANAAAKPAESTAKATQTMVGQLGQLINILSGKAAPGQVAPALDSLLGNF